MTALFTRHANLRRTWRLLAAILGIALFGYLLGYNLAIHDTLQKLKLPEGILEWLDILIGGEWGVMDLAWLGAMTLIWVLGFDRLLRLGLIWYALANVFTIVASVAALIITVAFRDEDVWGLLWDASLVWIGNIFAFGVWYWLIDAEHAQIGPGTVEAPGKRMEFLFPQRAGELTGWSGWQPRFFDYLFVAFTTATAFSPTETAPLSRRAKLLMMLQSLISLIVVAVLAARAINILKPPV
jgi:hypothetical protein